MSISIITRERIQGLLHIVYLVQGHEDDYRHVMHGKGSLRAPPILGSHTLPRRTNSRDLRRIARTGVVQLDILPQHWAG
jgi:hypothetical protein